MLTEDEVQANAKTYQEQVFRILDKKKTEVRYNSEWLGKMRPEDLLKLASDKKIELLIGPADLNIRFDLDGIMTLHQRIKKFHDRNGLSRFVAL